MNTRFRSRTHLRKIRSFHELELEKVRLQQELLNAEEKLNASYKHLTEQFTFRNIVARLIDELTTTSAAVSKAITVGKELFGAFKKKKKKWKERREARQAQPISVEPEAETDAFSDVPPE